MALAAAAPWIASVAGPILGGLFGRSGQNSANSANARMSREQMQFQERMSSTAHQREVADLKAAGLNPMLSAMGGSGASSPSGSSAHFDNPNEGLDRGISSASGAIIQKKMMEAQIENIRQSTFKTNADEYLAREQAKNILLTRPYTVANAKGVAEGQSLLNASTASVLEGQQIEGEIDKSSLGTVLRYLNRITGSVGGVTSLMPGRGVLRR